MTIARNLPLIAINPIEKLTFPAKTGIRPINS
jgi:hypothetical protein